MLFALICTDKPQALDLRLATRPAHLSYLQERAAQLIEAGPLLDPEGKPAGSLILIDVEDAAAAAAFAAADPYAQAGLFESVLIRPYRSIFRAGARVG